MPQTLQLEVATPERLLVREQVSEAQIPAKEGMIGILPDHAALIGELGTGSLTYVQPDGKTCIVVSGGFVEVRDNYVRVLADRAERLDEIDLARAEASLKRAQERMTLANIDVARAINAMRRAEARIAAAKAGH